MASLPALTQPRGAEPSSCPRGLLVWALLARGTVLLATPDGASSFADKVRVEKLHSVAPTEAKLTEEIGENLSGHLRK